MSVETIVENRAGAPFLIALCAVMAVAAAAGLLLPWPPDPAGVAMTAVVFAICSTVAWHLGGGREVRIDRVNGTVVEVITTFGLVRERRHRLEDFDALDVTAKSVRVARTGTDGRQRRNTDYEQHERFALTLRGRSRELHLATLADAVEAETRAVGLAALGGWQARRLGYALDLASDHDGRSGARVRIAAEAHAPMSAAR